MPYCLVVAASVLLFGMVAGAQGVELRTRTAVDTAKLIAPRADHAAVAAALERLIEHEMSDKKLPALSIALVDDQEVVWARGFGYANPGDSTPATAQTVYRVGSVSKLFTDIAVMQLAERGAIDVDAPVTRYIPAFKPRNPFGSAITLRQLMSHRAGLVREPPAGHYFDDTSPSLMATVRSLNSTALVYAPGSRTKYSNAGIAAVGYALELTQREPFAKYLTRVVLAPMRMRRSSFKANPALSSGLADALMWSYQGRTFPAPAFELGIAPAGSMYTTVTDLGRFLSVLFAGGLAGTTRILEQKTLEQMWTPQFAQRGESTGFGIGFGISRLEGSRRFGHGGAIYGFATGLQGLPDEKLGVVVVTTLDGANSVTDRIADTALGLMLANRAKRPLPPIELSAPLDAVRARRLAGHYVGGDRTIDLTEINGLLYSWSGRGGFRTALRSFGDTLLVDDPLQYGPRIISLGDSVLVIGHDTLSRTAVRKPPAANAVYAGLIGEYGSDFNTLYVLEKDGTLHALIEWFFDYPLTRRSNNVYAFPEWGLYHGEHLIFTRDARGRATQVEAAGIPFKRRIVGPESGGQLKIRAQRPISALRAEALSAEPPREDGTFRSADLVDIAGLDPTLKFDIRYATTNNFLGEVFYSEPRAFLQRPAAEALLRAHRALRSLGYGILVHDAYRPWYVTKMFWEATPEQHRWLVADPLRGSRHNRGAAADVTLYELATGRTVQMPGTYDELSDRTLPLYPGGTALQRWHRELLRSAMEAEGYSVYDAEWWHFDYKDWRQYPIGNLTFDRIAKKE
ncbi:MAG: serine hydrolase [Gemmatimonadaceae bacterium]